MRKILITILLVVSSAMFVSCMKYEKFDIDMSGAPRIITLPRQKMILAGSRGTAENISADCIGSLYSVYFALKFKGKVMTAPRARWPILPDAPKGEWVGIFGIPVPEEINSVPELKKKTKIDVKLGYWEYGETAEITHVGSYASETRTVEKLHEFISNNGYVISGFHEEVYVKGPGMFGRGNPDKYITLIRYQVKKPGKK